MKRVVTVAFFLLVSSPAWAGHVKQLAQLTADDARDLGSAVAISGTTIVTGSPSVTRTGIGHAYVYVKSGGQPVLAADLVDGGWDTFFGNSVAISGDANTIVVGAPGDLVRGVLGAAYVFVKPTGGWQTMPPTATLAIGRPDFFGFSVAISEDGKTLAVGAPGEVSSGRAGDVFVFVEPPTGWQDVTTAAANLSSPSAVGLGYSVAMGGDAVVAGSYAKQAVAYVFVKPPTGWRNAQPRATLTPSDSNAVGFFIAPVAIDGDTVVVGAPYQSNVGAAYVFVEPSGGWVDMNHTAELGIEAQSQSDLGYSVAIRNNVVLVGDPRMNVGQTYEQGIAAAYFRPLGGWKDTVTPDISVTSLGGGIGLAFGSSVSIDTTYAVIGAPGHKRMGAPTGAACVFGEQ